MLSTPTESFTISSLCDETRLECRLYHPDKLQDHHRRWIPKAAIIAHPYAPLGGSFDDPVVNAVGSELLRVGWVVGTFNLRGAGESEGRTSWTGKPELGDYISFYGLMMYYLHGLRSSFSDAQSSSSGPTGIEAWKPNLILCGYSYGSMLASYLPSAESVLELFASGVGKSAVQEIISSASRLSQLSSMSESQSKSLSQTSIPGSMAPSVSYLLVSPILPPISFFTALSLFTSGSPLDIVLLGTPVKSVAPADNLTAHPSLAVYGNNDTFTSVKKLRNWSAELAAPATSRFTYREIENAGHFWQDENAESQMRRTIREWASRLE